MNPYKQIRQDAGMTISQMAAYFGINERTVRRYEDGTRNAGGAVKRLYGLLNGENKTIDGLKE